MLPYRSDKKLYFTLCGRCVEQTNLSPCAHTDEERALIGTWVLCEVKTALNYGYVILERIELWLYNTDQYDAVTKTGGLFTEYMRTFLKQKQEASGWPQDCITEEQRRNYIREYEELDGITLDPEKIEVNPQYCEIVCKFSVGQTVTT